VPREPWFTFGRVAHEDPLAYLLGIEGLALLRGFIGERDKAFVDERIGEIRRLLADDALAAAGVPVERVDTVSGYREWAARYDGPRNGLFDFEEPHVRRVLDTLPAGPALDAACGTGRYAEHLAGAGHQVVGVDSSPEMLDKARERVPAADFLLGDLHRLPLGDNEVNVVVCALALTHLPSLEPAFAEFARVLRPGGHLLISDLHHEGVLRGSIPPVVDQDGTRGRLPAHRHLVGDYLRAALPLGFTVLACEEPCLPSDDQDDQPTPPAATELGPWELWPWSLSAMVPEAAQAASAGRPVTVVWHFRLTAER
jgi:SAM-dependent methyltransferase